MADGDLSEQLRSAVDAARALTAEAARLGGNGSTPATPAQGWQTPGVAGADAASGGPGPGPDVQALAAVLELVKASLPRELAVQALDLLRELLLAVRAVIDFYLERIDRRVANAEVEVEDIPIS